MSSIEAIGIAGFRSYNPSTLQKIEFNKPLTLIWGSNGSGKTVISFLLRLSLK
jgi:DNA repair protein RAD50